MNHYLHSIQGMKNGALFLYCIKILRMLGHLQDTNHRVHFDAKYKSTRQLVVNSSLIRKLHATCDFSPILSITADMSHATLLIH